MANKIFSAVCGLVLILFTVALKADDNGQALQQSLEEAQRLCDQGVSPQIEALAKSAGYDLDKLCASVELVGSQPSSAQIQEDTPVLRQKTTGSVSELVQSAEDVPASSQLKDINDYEIASEIGLQLFGYDLFAGEPITYQPGALMPVEPGYHLGPGDELRIQFYGKINDYFEQTISRDGSISFPKIGPLALAGLSFIEAKQLIDRKVAEEYIGVKASITLGELRSIHVFVLGEAYKPGTYTVPSLSTITNVLFLSGGVTDIASLRDIQLKRDGKVMSRLDLYNLLLSGDRSKDLRLQAGDTIFIPTLKRTASIDGQIRRPAIYEINNKSTVGQLIDLGGGLLPTAFRSRARIERIDNSGFMTTVDIDISTDTGLNTEVKNGDLLMIDAVADEQRRVVTLSGNLHHSGQFLWREGLKISDLINSIDSLKPNTDLDFALLRRQQLPTGKITNLYVDLGAVLADANSVSNIQLMPRDELMIFSNQPNRSQLFEDLIAELKLQSRVGEVTQVVTVKGTVHSPGDYPLTQNMSLTQLIAAAGGLKEQAYTQAVEVTSFDLSDGQQVKAQHRVIDLLGLSAGRQENVLLQPGDIVTVRSVPEYRETMTMELTGEVRLPGTYTFLQGETLSDLIKRAGGLTESAHAKAAVFTRKDLRDQEQQRLQELGARLQADIAAANMEGEKRVDVENEKKILQRLGDEQAVGRLVIDLAAILQGALDDITLKDGDLLVIPEYRQEVSVIGEVLWPSAHQFNSRLKIGGYLKLAGGVDARADKKRVYVVKADGSVSMPKGLSWLGWGRVNIEPGDTIVMPMDVDRQRPMALWRDASSIIYQLSLGAAAIKSF